MIRLLTLLLTLAPLAMAQAPSDADITRWIGELGAESFATRERATARLERAGAAALPRLRETAASSEDPEIRARCLRLIGAIERGQAGQAERPPRRPARGPDDNDLPDALRRLIERGLKELAPDPDRPLELEHEGARLRFRRTAGGGFEIERKKGDEQATVQSFRSEAELKAKAPKLHALWKRERGGMFSTEGAVGREIERQRAKLERLFGEHEGDSEKAFEELMKDSLEELIERALRSQDKPGKPAPDAATLRAALEAQIERLKRLLDGDLSPEMRKQLLRWRDELRRRLRGVGKAKPAPKAESQPRKLAPGQRYVMGATVSPLPPALAAQLGDGVLVVALDPGTPAAQLGVKVHDVAVSVDGAPIKTPKALEAAVAKATAAGKIELVVLRGGKRLTLRGP